MKRQAGWGLVETVLTLGALSALSLGIYMVLSPTSANAKAKVEQDNLRDLSTAVDRSFGLLGNFHAVSASRLLEDGLAPTRMVDGTTLRTAWGTAVDIVPHAVNAPADGFLIVYPFAPSDVCPRLAAAVSRDVFDIRVEGVSVFDGGQLNPSAAAAACGQSDTATMEFIYHSGLVAGSAVAAPPLVLPPVSPSVSRPTSTPMGGSVGPAGPVDPAAPVGPVSAAPAATPAPLPVAPTATPPAVAPTTPTAPPSGPVAPPPTTVSACVVPPSEARSLATCPAGTWGVSHQQRQWWCGDVGGVYEAWATAQPGAWTDTGNTCASCPTPSTQTTTQWLPSSSACPSGQVGTITWQYEQSRSRSVSYDCPAGTTSVPGPTYGAWSSWSNTGATSGYTNTCATACSLPTPSTQTNTETRTGSQTLACPVGQTGAITQQRPEQRTQTRSASCPAPTGAYTWSGWSAWSAWTGTGAWTTTSNTCVETCVAPATEYFAITRVASNETRDVGCPSGQTGNHWQARSRTENGQHVRTWSCPSPTGSPVASGVDNWLGTYSYGSWATTSNTCTPSSPNCGATPVEPTPICSFVLYMGAATSAANCSAGNYNWAPGSATGYWCHLHVHIDPGYSCSYVTATACPTP